MKSKLREVILDQIEFLNLDIETSLKKIKFPEAYFDAMITEQHNRLPAFPYVRTHLVNLAEHLELDPDEILTLYKQEFSEKISGSHDVLPSNRFALPSTKRHAVVAGIIIAAIALAYFVSTSSFFGRPKLTVTYPPKEPSPFVVTEETIRLAGSIGSSDDLLINGQAIVRDEETEDFEVMYPLQSEINTIIFEAKRFLGGSVRVSRQVYLDLPEPLPATSTPVNLNNGTTTF